jgi:rhodanese-related sulfurtransferase
VKFILDNILLVGIAVMSGLGLLLPALMPRGKRATPAEVVQIINRGKFLIVDVRSAEEYAAAHVRDAKHIPLADFDKRIGELEKSKSKSIVVMCQRGAQADRAVRLLQAAGFEDVTALDGGLLAWQAAGMPTVK